MTKTKKHHWLFKLWIKIRGLLAVMVVLAGLAVGVLSLLLPFEFLYQDRLEKFLQQQWGLEVQLEEVDGSWQGYGPYFLLSNLKLTGKQSIQLESANLSINIYQLLIPGGRTGIDLSIN
ncbi:MAG: YhdP family protein, partial [Marinicella sp.]